MNIRRTTALSVSEKEDHCTGLFINLFNPKQHDDVGILCHLLLLCVQQNKLALNIFMKRGKQL